MDLFDVDAVEAVEQQLDQFIEKRAREARDAEKVAELWAESARRDLERRREENRLAWIEFHSRLAASHARIVAEHEASAAVLAGEGAG